MEILYHPCQRACADAAGRAGKDAYTSSVSSTLIIRNGRVQAWGLCLPTLPLWCSLANRAFHWRIDAMLTMFVAEK